MAFYLRPPHAREVVVKEKEGAVVGPTPCVSASKEESDRRFSDHCESVIYVVDMCGMPGIIARQSPDGTGIG